MLMIFDLLLHKIFFLLINFLELISLLLMVMIVGEEIYHLYFLSMMLFEFDEWYLADV